MADNFDPEVMRKFVEALADATRQVDEITLGQRKEKEEREKNIAAIKAFRTNLGNATKELGKAMVSASDGASKYAVSVEAAGSAAYDLGKSFGALGAIAGGLINVFSKLVGASLRQQDALAKTYRSLSKFGDLDNASFAKLLSDLQTTGFSINDNAERYVEAIKKVAPELSIFSGSVSEGRKQLVSTFKMTLGETEKQLARLGYTTEEMFEKTGSMIAQMAFSNNKSKLTSEQLNKQSVVYMETLSALADLTGQSRDALEEQRKAQMNDLRFQMYLSKLRPEQAEAEKNQAMMMEAVYGKKAAQGYISKVVNFGRTVDNSAANFNRTFGEQGYRNIREGMKLGGNQAVNFARTMEKNNPILRRRFDEFGNVIALGNEYGDELGFNIELFSGSMRQAGTAAKLEKLLADRKNNTANADIDAYTDRMQKERQLRIAYEKALQSAAPDIQNALNKFIDIVWKTAKQMAQILKKIGGPDYTDAFRDVTDVTEELNIHLKRYRDRQKEISNLQEKRKSASPEEQKQIDKDIDHLQQRQKKLASHLLKLDREYAEKGGKPENAMRKKDVTTLSEVAGEKVDLDRVLPKAKATRYSSNDVAGMKIEDLVVFGGGLTGTKEHFEKLDKAVQDDFIAMAYEYNKATGQKLRINSAFRSMQEQMAVNSGGNPKAEPGTSMHEKGRALDLNSDQVRVLQRYGFLSRYGFSPLEGDPPHIQHGAMEGGFFNGPKSGYLVEQHGPEGTFNFRQMTALNNALTKTPISGGGSPTAQDTRFMEIMDRVAGYMETLTDLQRSSNSTQEDLLKYAKA